MELKVLGDGTTVLTVATKAGHDGRKQIARLVFSEQFAEGYRVERELGAGAMGAVYAGVQLATGRPVAVKFLLAIGEPEAAARFQREARLLAKVSHPAVLRVIDVGELSGHPFLVTDLLPGGSLRARLTREVRLTPAAAVATATRVLEGLEACHAAGVVHRDLKPDNVMYDAQGLAVVVDLGIARLVDDVASLTRTGAMVGTPRYMAPEAWSGDLVGPPADIFAVGVMMYEAIAGRHPFESANTPQELLELLEKGPPPLVEAARVAPGLAALVHRALAWSPSGRPASAAAMRAELGSAALMRSGSTKRPVASRAVPAPVAPEKRPYARAAVAAVACAAVLAGVLAWPRPTPVVTATPAVTATPVVTATPSAVSSPSPATPAGVRTVGDATRRVIALAPTADRVCLSDAAGLHLMPLPEGTAVSVTPRPVRRIDRAVFAPDGRQLALIDGYAAPAGRTTRTIVEVDTGKIAHQWTAPTMKAWFVQLGPTALFERSRELAVVRDLATGHDVWNTELSPSATEYLTTDSLFTRFCRSSASVWDIVSRDAVKTQAQLLAAIDTADKDAHVRREELCAVPHAFTPDGVWVFLDERLAKEIWMLPSRGHKPRWRIPHPSASWLTVTSVSPDGTLLAGAYEDGTLAVWKVKNGQLVDRRRAPAPGVQIAVDAASRRLVSVSAAGVASIYDLGGR